MSHFLCIQGSQLHYKLQWEIFNLLVPSKVSFFNNFYNWKT